MLPMSTMMIVTVVIVVVVVAVIVSVFLVLVLALALALILVPVLVLVLASRRSAAARASSDGGARDGHGGFREGLAAEGSTGQADGRTRENRSHKCRIRHRRGFGDPPEHVVAGRRGTAWRDHREAGARQGAGPKGPDLEDPDPVRGPVERQQGGGGGGARRGRRRVETIDTG